MADETRRSLSFLFRGSSLEPLRRSQPPFSRSVASHPECISDSIYVQLSAESRRGGHAKANTALHHPEASARTRGAKHRGGFWSNSSDGHSAVDHGHWPRRLAPRPCLRCGPLCAPRAFTSRGSARCSPCGREGKLSFPPGRSRRRPRSPPAAGRAWRGGWSSRRGPPPKTGASHGRCR